MCEHARQLVYPDGERVGLECYARYAVGVRWQRPVGLPPDVAVRSTGRGLQRRWPRL
jgi:hypothetical protein